MKSLTVSVFWPTWCWAQVPDPKKVLLGASSRWIFATYDQGLSTDRSVKRRNLMESPWYRERWGERVRFSKDQNQKTEYTNTARGTGAG